MKILNVIILTILLFVVTIFSTGTGHGTFVLIKLVYPYAMLVASNELGLFALLLAIVEIPVYGYVFYRKPRWKYYVLVLHILAVILCFLIGNENFSG